MIPEPSPGSVVRFTKSRRYTYVCYRIQDDPTFHDPEPWYTTASWETDTNDEGDGDGPYFGKYVSWENIIEFAHPDPIDIATAWKTLPQFPQ